MAKKKRGMPDSFDIAVEEGALGPVDIDDFIDENIPGPKKEVSAEPRKEHPTPPPAKEVEREEVIAEERQEAKGSSGPRRRRATRPGKGKKIDRRPPRKEISLDGETLRMLEQIVEDARKFSSEGDVRASEVIRSLVHSAYDARRQISFENVHPRGQWGSATARSFIADLKESFTCGVGKLYNDRYRH